MTHTPTGDAETIEGLRRELADERLRSTVFERQYRQACSDHASVMAELDNLRTCLIAIRRRTIFGPSITTSDLLDLTSDVAGLAAEKPQCVHAPTYDAGLCCGHPDDCTFVSPPKPASRLCDCERGHNGIGIVGRECDCGPAAEFAFLRESLAKAEDGHEYCKTVADRLRDDLAETRSSEAERTRERDTARAGRAEAERENKRLDREWQAAEAALAKPAPAAGDVREALPFPTYGEMSADDLGQAVMAAIYGELEPYKFDPSHMKGHQIVRTINFNSLNRIVTWFVQRAALSAPASAPGSGGEAFQQRVQPWMLACFGEEISRDVIERNHRFLEEALELVQSTGCTASEAHQLVDYVYGRDVGDPPQEVGGVMVTLAALCLATGMDMHSAGETELARVWTKVEKIRAKQAAKPKHSPLPQHVASPSPAQGETR